MWLVHRHLEFWERRSKRIGIFKNRSGTVRFVGLDDLRTLQPTDYWSRAPNRATRIASMGFRGAHGMVAPELEERVKFASISAALTISKPNRSAPRWHGLDYSVTALLKLLDSRYHALTVHAISQPAGKGKLKPPAGLDDR